MCYSCRHTVEICPWFLSMLILEIERTEKYAHHPVTLCVTEVDSVYREQKIIGVEIRNVPIQMFEGAKHIFNRRLP